MLVDVTQRRPGHEMESLLQYDCLPRLVDAALCPEGPETSVLRSWRSQLSDDRPAAPPRARPLLTTTTDVSPERASSGALSRSCPAPTAHTHAHKMK